MSLAHLQTMKGANPNPKGRRRQLNSKRSQKAKITVLWLCRTADDHDDPFAVAQRNETEEVCRAEADDLGLNFVVIRQGLHETRNLTHEGIPVTFYDRQTQRWQTVQRQADWHFTVWMGKSKDELLIQGHIFVQWDGTSMGSFCRMKNPKEQRKFLVDGEEPVSAEFWCLTKDEPFLKEEAQLLAPGQT